MKRTDDRSRHVQIAADLRSKILSGDLTENLPSFSQLMAMYSTSNNTAQRAVGLLKAEGYVEGHHGKGLTIRPERFAIVDAESFDDPAATNISYKILRAGPERPPADAAGKLGLSHEETALLRQWLKLRGDEPIELAWSYYPDSGSEQASGDAPVDLAAGGNQPQTIVDEFMVREPTTEELETLELPAGTPVMRLLQTISDAQGSVLEVTITIKGGHLYGMRYERTRPANHSGARRTSSTPHVAT